MKKAYQNYLEIFDELTAEQPALLQAVFERTADDCCDALLLQFPGRCLVFLVNPDDDTLEVAWQEPSAAKGAEWSRLDADEPWRQLLGKSLGWGWIAVNQQGYCDGALLSFDGITPTVLINVMASGIQVHGIIPHGKTSSVT